MDILKFDENGVCQCTRCRAEKSSFEALRDWSKSRLLVSDLDVFYAWKTQKKPKRFLELVNAQKESALVIRFYDPEGPIRSEVNDWVKNASKIETFEKLMHSRIGRCERMDRIIDIAMPPTLVLFLGCAFCLLSILFT